jgi:hypothetical protein
MVIGMFRVLLGFALACLAAGLTMVLFVYTPLELAREHAGDRMSEAGLLALAVATHTAMFAAPFALIGAGFAEWRRIGGWLYYVLVGIAIAAGGFAAQSWTESGGEAQGSILNSYAVAAFLVTGGVAGLVYWLCAGRRASARDGRQMPAPNPPAPSQVPQAGKPEGTSAGIAS